MWITAALLLSLWPPCRPLVTSHVRSSARLNLHHHGLDYHCHSSRCRQSMQCSYMRAPRWTNANARMLLPCPSATHAAVPRAAASSHAQTDTRSIATAPLGLPGDTHPSVRNAVFFSGRHTPASPDDRTSCFSRAAAHMSSPELNPLLSIIVDATATDLHTRRELSSMPHLHVEWDHHLLPQICGHGSNAKCRSHTIFFLVGDTRHPSDDSHHRAQHSRQDQHMIRCRCAGSH
jgi:hypothetical protein